jgi:hypothetical protein
VPPAAPGEEDEIPGSASRLDTLLPLVRDALLMAVAYFMRHAPRSFFPVLNGGDLAILFCFVFLYFVAGGGLWSVDAQRSSRRGLAPAT